MGEPCKCPQHTDGWRWHDPSCPVVAFFAEVQREVLPSLTEMDRVRQRGAAQAAFYVIGSAPPIERRSES